MVPILDGDSEIGAHVWRDLGYLICLRHLFRSTAFTNITFFLWKDIYMRNIVTYYKLPCNTSTMLKMVCFALTFNPMIWIRLFPLDLYPYPDKASLKPDPDLTKLPGSGSARLLGTQRNSTFFLLQALCIPFRVKAWYLY